MNSKISVVFLLLIYLITDGFTLENTNYGEKYYRRYRPREIRASEDDPNGEWKLRILHTNDMHSRFNQTSKGSTDCREKDAKKGKCYGGFGRIATLVREIKQTSSEPVLFLNAGDNFFGTPWFDIFREKIVLDMMNLLKPDAMALGNHEFEHGPEKLVPFINNATFPIVTCNLDMSNECELQESKLLPYTILSAGGHSVGIIGYLTRETMDTAEVGGVKILDEIICLRKYVEVLKSKGVEIIIGLGHSGYKRDQEIAAAVDGLDLIIGGHTNTFLYNGAPPDQEVPEGEYPTVVTQPSGRKVYVVQAYAYTKYLGNLEITFDNRGEVVRVSGNPILVNSSTAEAEDVVKALDKYRPSIIALGEKKIGESRVALDGPKRCKVHECNTGNLVLDAMVDYSARQYLGKDQWTDAAVAILNSGSFKTAHAAHEDITMNDVYSIIAYDEIMGTVDFTGEDLLKAFEHSVRDITYEDANRTEYVEGRFLQVSGVKISYDLSKPKGSKVIPNSVFIRCADCSKPVFEPLDKAKTYKVLVGDFLRRGEDGYTFIKDLPWTSYDVTMRKVFSSYVTYRTPIFMGEEDRITFVHSEDKKNENSVLLENKFYKIYTDILETRLNGLNSRLDFVNSKTETILTKLKKIMERKLKHHIAVRLPHRLPRKSFPSSSYRRSYW